MSKLILLGYLTASALFSVVGNIFGKRWATQPRVSYLTWTLILFTVSSVFYLFALRYEKLGVVSITWDMLTSLGLVTIGYFVFKEVLTPVQFGGIALIFIGQYLLFR